MRIEGGEIEGAVEGGLTVYKGVPFAAPPVGDLRWKAPQPVKPWSGVVRADAFKPQCPQPAFPFMAGPPPAESEDCLYLNIWTPAEGASEKLPVMVWIHGGAFTGGSPSMDLFWGDNLAKRGVVVVNLAYRVGALGFLTHPELTAESPTHSSGNYGLMDLILGLEWVRRNIAKFGGDPDKVTVFGESAGSMAVHLLTVSPLATGLFRAAIGESGAVMTTWPAPAGAKPLVEAEKSGIAYAEKLGAKNLRALRALAPEKLIAQQQDVSWPVIDGAVIAETPYATYASGKAPRIPMIIGTNANEGSLFMRNAPGGAKEFIAQVKETFGEDADAALKLYPANTEAEAKDSRDHLMGDTLFGWNDWAWARLASRGSKVFHYHFAHAPPDTPGSPFNGMGATHAAEMAYVFGHPGLTNWAERDKRLSEQMQSYWTNLAKTGDPNGAGVPEWPAFTEAGGRVMHFEDKPIIRGVAYKEKLELLNKRFAPKPGN